MCNKELNLYETVNVISEKVMEKLWGISYEDMPTVMINEQRISKPLRMESIIETMEVDLCWSEFKRNL
jgi:hypothetical protein